MDFCSKSMDGANLSSTPACPPEADSATGGETTASNGQENHPERHKKNNGLLAGLVVESVGVLLIVTTVPFTLFYPINSICTYD